jgi:hypothetical protein
VTALAALAIGDARAMVRMRSMRGNDGHHHDGEARHACRRAVIAARATGNGGAPS